MGFKIGFPKTHDNVDVVRVANEMKSCGVKNLSSTTFYLFTFLNTHSNKLSIIFLSHLNIIFSLFFNISLCIPNYYIFLIPNNYIFKSPNGNCKHKISQLQKIKQLKRNMVCKYKFVLINNEYDLYFNSFIKEYPLILSSLNLTQTRDLLDFGWKMDWTVYTTNF